MKEVQAGFKQLIGMNAAARKSMSGAGGAKTHHAPFKPKVSMGGNVGENGRFCMGGSGGPMLWTCRHSILSS